MNAKRLWKTVFFLGLVFDILFWGKAPGISFPLFVALILLSGILLLADSGIRPNKRALGLILPIGFFATMVFLRTEPLTTFLNYTLTFVFLGFFALTYRGGRWLSYSLSDYFLGFLRLGGNAVARPLYFIGKTRREQEQAGDTRVSGNFFPVLRGLLFALPIVVIFAALLSSADAIFAQRIEAFLKLFRLENWAEYFWQGALITLVAYLLAGFLLYAAQESQDEKLIGEEKPVLKPFLGFTEASIVLGSVLFLFSAFVLVQFQYFFGGQANIHLDGYTYAEYARRGFGELVTVALFSLFLFLGLSTITRRKAVRSRKIFSGMGIALVLLVLVILLSAFRRLTLYENVYGYSRLRIYSHVFMIWLGVLLVAVVVLEILQKQRSFAPAMTFAIIGFAATLNLLNVDGFIVRRNILRSAWGANLDTHYLATLSDDMLPALVEGMRAADAPSQVREELAVTAICHWYADEAHFKEKRPWQSFHLSYWQASRLYQEINPLDGYTVVDDGWTWHVNAPGGEIYDCPDRYDWD